MRNRRLLASGALVATFAMALSACGGGSGGGNNDINQKAAANAKGKVTVAETNTFTSFNTSTPDGNVDINSKVQLATTSDFNYIGEDFKVVKDTSFGSYEVVSQDPFQVKYTVNEGVKWSDGTQVGADDLLLAWAVLSGYYDDATIDPNTGEVTKGTQYFTYAGTTLPDLLTKFPEVGSDGRSITITYDKPYADWEIAFGVRITPPAHVVWQHAGIKSADDFINLLKSTPKGDPSKPAKPNAQLQKVANFWNTGFDSKRLPKDKSLYLSDGPFVVSDVQQNAPVTMVANDQYTGDHAPQVKTIVMRTIGDPTAQVKALRNGEVDVIAPQASADTLKSIDAIKGATMHTGPQVSYDHLDIMFNSPVFKDKNVREAFLKTIPRQKILDAVITPLDPNAELMNSQIFLPSQPHYDDAVAANNSDEYQSGKPDIAGAKKLLAGQHPTVKILYNKDNPNRVDAYTLIARSASQAGFNVVDGGEGGDEWGADLNQPGHDVNVFGWISSGVGVSGVPQIFGTRQGGNYNGYSNPTVDKLDAQLMSEPDTEKQAEIEYKIDAELWKDQYGLPLFQSVGVDAESSRVDLGTDNYYPGQSGVWWNVWEWSVNNG